MGRLLRFRGDREGKRLWQAKVADYVLHQGFGSSPAVYGPLVLVSADNKGGGAVAALDRVTGEVVWNERVGGKYAASPIYADGRLYFFSQDGVTTVIKPGVKLEVLARNQLDDGLMASPAADGKAFYLRTKSSLYRVESTGAGER